MSEPPATAPAPEAGHISREVLRLLIPHRRTVEPDPHLDTPDDFPEQLGQIADFVACGERIVFSLPGFPCKSPNPEKVLGRLPDQGERLALRFLDSLCAEIEKVHAPGAKVLICSDGHIFGDVIRVPDEHVDAYNDALLDMIRAEGLAGRLDTFDLRDCYGPDLSYDEKRRLAARTLGPTPEELRAEVREDESSLRMYLGITRFLVEDATGWEGSRSALQRDCRRRAYEVILRSRAWSELISERYPHHVRLSIHPQNRGAAKFGIRLLGAADAWTTPWHSAPLRRADGTWELMHRRDAEKIGREVHRDGRPSHFEETGGAADAPAV
ncbi:isocyanide synthase family protein [Streptomyces somaliensis DSM 40738]|uniref:L-tyrosine/L-tryptophan isonitrile synthase family protein n=1 Tax=Streptomyces somaliensis (strain ATCC 33201 / DSM 40738 / JCM 12659 / KCTC 9044 / NCTC 11332 / NRRL B-12077 / IP 733) TaxID=1134445 RepID=A0AA44DDA0_STRE0|nr:isocyanide synthase family protein [Streptomyces somaliensis]MCQ0023174.1 isocyanide synthase family protein [Streptomyces somaliensis DSM 40738]NKY14773.1 L-tyrosine/L-tryptophan isonitrile synthase family protein [Streptomyces somaliensis DSM 40738]